ncbi:MAG: enoyl-CoA hydratase-related protein [Alphaproteobacteria bacterium]
MAEMVKTVKRGGVLEITLDRPPANAINRATSYALYDAFKMLKDDPALIVGIITGSGERIFSAGWDLKEVASGDELSDPAVMDLGPGGLGGLTEFFDLHKPVIAAVNGHAVGGGFELAMAADIIIAAEHAEFFLPEMQRGFVPDAGAVQRLGRILPFNVAMDLLLTGRRMGAAEARQWGMVRDVVPSAELMPRARALADAVAECAPLAVQGLMEIMDALAPLSVRDSFALTHRGWKGVSGLNHYERMLRSEDYSEGPRAFAEKRKPVWKGR